MSDRTNVEGCRQGEAACVRGVSLPAAPYFPQRLGLVGFPRRRVYDQRFNIGFTDQDKVDLVALLEAL